MATAALTSTSVESTVDTTVDTEVLARVGAALSDGVRRAILVELISGSHYPAILASTLGVSRSRLSNHLACLRGCGLVTATYEGRQVRYDLAHPAIGAALIALSKLPLGPCPEDRQP